ncbi:LysR family transcriptional regulator [Vibrio parahaemolyticus]|uniref:LysR family transcriptional regulator n=1 Tax=Vibrio parahaemolyticus TaxID=670 RepID=UPI00235DD1C0|nr:LysR family transcriptional regulator [Vibrio parahaemolyticus]
MDKQIDLNLLQVFIAVYRHRSITVAAEALELTQPGISGMLKRLQHQLGVTLFVRDGRGISPTHHAKELVRKIEPALIQVHNSLESLKTFNTDISRKFVVYTPEPLMFKLLPKIEHDESLGNIEIELRPILSKMEQQLNELNLQQADLAIDFMHHSADSFFTEPLASDDICVITRKRHPRIQGQLSMAQYYEEKHVTLKLRRENACMADYFTEELLRQRKVAAECDSMTAQMILVANSDCIALVTKNFAQQFSTTLGLQIITSPFTCMPIRYRLMAHNREKNNPANSWLRAKLKSYVTLFHHNMD